MKKFFGIVLIFSAFLFLSNLKLDAGSRERIRVGANGVHQHFHATGRRSVSCSGAAARVTSCSSSRGRARLSRVVKFRSLKACPKGGC